MSRVILRQAWVSSIVLLLAFTGYGIGHLLTSRTPRPLPLPAPPPAARPALPATAATAQPAPAPAPAAPLRSATGSGDVSATTGCHNSVCAVCVNGSCSRGPGAVTRSQTTVCANGKCVTRTS